MEKKEYSAPEVKTEKVEMGVFGSYAQGGCGSGGFKPPAVSMGKKHKKSGGSKGIFSFLGYFWPGNW